MGRYYKGISKQIKLAGVVGGVVFSVALAGATKVYAAEEAVLLSAQTAVTEEAAVAEVPYYNVKGYGWKKSGSDWTYVKKDGTLAVNWLKDADNKWYFLSEEGTMLKGFIEWKNQKYYLNADGSMQEGWFKWEDGIYYFRPGNGDMFIGMQVIDGVSYDFGADGKAVGLTEIPSATIVTPEVTVPEVPEETMGTDVGITGITTPEVEAPTVEEPVVAEIPSVYYDVAGYGWKQNSDGSWSYYNKNGLKAKNWLFDETNHWFFMGEDGKMQTGYIEWCEQRYFLHEDGRMQEGFMVTEEGIYYFRPGNGDMILGFHTIDNVLYNFGEDGKLLTGWQTYNDATYFFNPLTGEAAKGIVLIDGVQYGFNAEGKLDASVIPWNLLLVNYKNTMPENYEISLKKVSGYNVDARIADSLSAMINAAKTDGVKLRITSAYRTIATQTRLYNNGLTSRLNKGMSYEEAVAERNLYNAEPGKSEHNLGLALVFISGSTLDDSFENSSQAAWLSVHAHEYGFILRYESDKVDITKIAYEPWHYRYVGVEAAAAMHESGACMEEFFKNYYTVIVADTVANSVAEVTE